MSTTIKIGTNSICPNCETTPQTSECTTCFICKDVFHAVCGKLEDGKLGTKTMVKAFVFDFNEIKLQIPM